MEAFKFQLGQSASIIASRQMNDDGTLKTEEAGIIIARCERMMAEPSYFLRYRAADGRATEQWWDQSALDAA